MDVLGIVDVPNWILCILAFVSFIYFYGRYKHTYFKRHGLPSKPTTFMFGDLKELQVKGVMDYLNENTVKEYGKVFGMYLGNIPFLCVNDIEMVKQIFVKDFPNSLTDWRLILMLNPGIQLSLLLVVTIGDFYVQRLVHHLHRMQPLVERCTKSLITVLRKENAKNPDGFDISPLIQVYTMDMIMSVGFGVDASMETDTSKNLLKYAREILDTSKIFNPFMFLYLLFPELSSTWLGKLTKPSLVPKKPFKFFKEITDAIIADRKKNSSGHKDLLQLMLNTQKGEQSNEVNENETLTLQEFKERGLTDEEVLVNSLTFLIAAYETNQVTITWVICDLLANPRCIEKLVEEIDENVGNDEPSYDNISKLKYLDMVVNESLRIHPATTRLIRTALEDVNVQGMLIKKGMSILTWSTALHFMPEYWEDPRTYNPERFSSENQANINEYAYFPFGLGPRNCIGKRLALLEVKITIVKILQTFHILPGKGLEIPMPPKKMSGKPDKPVLVHLEEHSQ